VHDMAQVLDRHAAHDIARDQVLQWDDLVR